MTEETTPVGVGRAAVQRSVFPCCNRVSGRIYCVRAQARENAVEHNPWDLPRYPPQHVVGTGSETTPGPGGVSTGLTRLFWIVFPLHAPLTRRRRNAVAKSIRPP